MKIWIIEPDETCSMTLLLEYVHRLRRETQSPAKGGSDQRMRQEKRLYERMPCLLLADYAAQDYAYRAFVKNISCDGAFIESPRPVPTDSEIVLVLPILDDAQPLKLAGEVVWADQQGMGVKFNHLAGCTFHPPAPPE